MELQKGKTYSFSTRDENLVGIYTNTTPDHSAAKGVTIKFFKLLRDSNVKTNTRGACGFTDIFNIKEYFTQEQLKEQSEALKNVWKQYLDTHGVSDESKRLQNEWIAFNKKHFSIILSINDSIVFFGTKSITGQIDFSAISGWIDNTPVMKVVNGRYRPNDLGEKVGITYPRGGGSAYLEFDPTEENLLLIKRAYEDMGYNIEILPKK